MVYPYKHSRTYDALLLEAISLELEALLVSGADDEPPVGTGTAPIPSLAEAEAEDGASDTAEDSEGEALMLAMLASLARLALSNTTDL